MPIDPQEPATATGNALHRFLAPALVIGVLMGFFAIVVMGRDTRPTATTTLGLLADPDEVYDPVTAGEQLPDGFRQVLARDAILPIYDPTFVPGAESNWPGDSLVIGLALGDESKAYPVRLLNQREMVVDSLAGIPVLVTW